MKRKNKVRPFARRLTRRLVLMLLVVMGLVAFVIFSVGGGFASISEAMRHVNMLETSSEYIRRVLSDVYVGTTNQIPEMEESLDRPDRLLRLVERTVAQNPRIHSTGISFVADYYPQKGRCYMPYATRRDSATIDVSDMGPSRAGYLDEEWFSKALATKDGFWTEPYFEAGDSLHPLVAYVRPLHDRQGRAVAVVGSSVSLQWLSDRMEAIDWDIFSQEWRGYKKEEIDQKKNAKRILLRKPYSFLISGKGTFIVHPDHKRMVHDNYSSIVKATDDTTAAFIGRNMMAGISSKDVDDDIAYCDNFDGRDSYVFYRPIRFTDWSLALVVPDIGIDLVFYVVGGMLVFFILIAILVVWLVCRYTIRRAVRPLNQLAASANEVAQGRFDTPLPTIRHNDEIRQLRDSFDDMQQSLTRYVDELKSTTASKAAIENELRIAHDIQMSMLPKTFPAYPDRSDIDVFGSLTPAKAVGGDLFDFYIRDEKLFFCIGDVSGKGVPASLVMAVVRSLFRNVSAHVTEPEPIVKALNDALSDGNDSNMFVTAFVGVLDLATGHLHYSNAGHDAPLLIGSDGCTEVPCTPNLPIGVMAGWQFTRQELTLTPGTSIFLYTDGLNEAENRDHDQFKMDRVVRTAEQLVAEGTLQSDVVISRMTDAVHRFVDGAEQSDDLTMLAIRYTP